MSDIEKKDISDLLIDMAQVASFIRSRNFKKVVQSKEHRFDSDLTPLFNKLRADLEFQLVQGVEKSKIEPDSEVNGRPYYSAETLAEPIADGIDASIAKIANFYTVDLPAKNKGKFTVPKGQDVNKAAFNAFNLDKMEAIVQKMNKIDTPLSYLGTFYTRNAMSSISLFIESSNTLRCSTHNADFERVLGELIKKPTYFTEGYPHDILAHDAKLVRECKKLVGIAMNTDYASSKAIFKGNNDVAPEGCIYHPIRKAGMIHSRTTTPAMSM